MKNQGYIEISSVLVISAVLLIVGTSVTLLTINDLQTSQSNIKSETALHLVEGCVEDALLRLNKFNNIPATINIPEGTCSATINSQGGTTTTFTISATIDSFTKSVQVTADRYSNITITNWIQQ